MNVELKEAIQKALDDLLAMSPEELDKMLEEAKNDPLYGIVQTLDDMSKVVYAEYNPYLYTMNMPWKERRDGML